MSSLELPYLVTRNQTGTAHISPYFHLQKHINEAQSTLAEKNAHAIRKACAEAKSTNLRQFTHRISALVLPVAPSALKSECTRGKEEALQAFDGKMGVYSDTDAYKEARKELEVNFSI